MQVLEGAPNPEFVKVVAEESAKLAEGVPLLGLAIKAVAYLIGSIGTAMVNSGKGDSVLKYARFIEINLKKLEAENVPDEDEASNKSLQEALVMLLGDACLIQNNAASCRSVAIFPASLCVCV